MDIVKQIQIVIIILVAAVTIPPVLSHYNVPIKDIVYKVLFIERPQDYEEAAPAKPEDVFKDRQDDSIAALSQLPNHEIASTQQKTPSFSGRPQLPQQIDITFEDDTAVEYDARAAEEEAKRQAAEFQDIKNRITGLEALAQSTKTEEPAQRPEDRPEAVTPPVTPPLPPQSSPAAQYSTKENLVEGVPVLFDNSPFKQKIKWIGPPPGFHTKEAYNMMIYRENKEVTPKITSTLEQIHGNLMLDLLPFTMSMKKNRILVMLFGTKESFGTFTKRPPWSGAASDLQRDTLYLVESNSFYPLSIHEMTHLYFDGFFLPAQSPLWLSEGMAVYMQSNTAQGAPEWVGEAMEEFKRGNIMHISDLVKIDTLKNFSDRDAELWYAQSFSVVDYLLNSRSRNEFYQFCVNLKEGMPVDQALYRAYGLPFNKIENLESVWYHDLKKGKK